MRMNNAQCAIGQNFELFKNVCVGRNKPELINFLSFYTFLESKFSFSGDINKIWAVRNLEHKVSCVSQVPQK